jgi:hypothetical protein
MSTKSTFPVKLNFTGLCEFVPRYDIEDIRTQEKGGHYGYNRVKVLLVDASEPLEDAHYENNQYPYEEHIPVFVCPSKNIGSGYRQADESFYSRFYAERMSMFYLHDQEIWIDKARPDKLTIEYSYSTGCSNAEKLDSLRESFAWVAPLAEISPGSEEVHPDCLNPVGCPAGIDDSVLSRVELSEGTLRTFLIAMDGDKQVVNWKFKVPGTRSNIRHRQSIADIVQFETEVMNSGLYLNTTLFRTSKNGRVRALFEEVGDTRQIHVVSDGSEVMAWILNMPLLDIWRARDLTPGPRKPEVHFAHFYKLSSDYGDPNVPHQAEQCPYRDPRHQGNPNCPPARAAAARWDPIVK